MIRKQKYFRAGGPMADSWKALEEQADEILRKSKFVVPLPFLSLISPPALWYQASFTSRKGETLEPAQGLHYPANAAPGSRAYREAMRFEDESGRCAT